jgi:hypothetical protein
MPSSRFEARHRHTPFRSDRSICEAAFYKRLAFVRSIDLLRQAHRGERYRQSRTSLLQLPPKLDRFAVVAQVIRPLLIAYQDHIFASYEFLQAALQFRGS